MYMYYTERFNSLLKASTARFEYIYICIQISLIKCLWDSSCLKVERWSQRAPLPPSGFKKENS